MQPDRSTNNDPVRDTIVVRLMALLDIPAVGPAGVQRLVRACGSVQHLIAVLDGDEPPAAAERLSLLRRVRDSWRTVSLDRYIERLRRVVDAGDSVIVRDDDFYPSNLREIGNSPPLLYVRGSLAGLQPRALALVGSVDPTERGLARARKFARCCAENEIQVISGLARGIDGASHAAALAGGQPTFAVLGHGLDHLYPPEHRALATEIAQHGALVSQFPPETPPSRWTFPARNELMCTIASGTVIIEIERTSKLGSVIQARFSIKHGRPVFVLRSNLSELKSAEARSLVESGDATEVVDFDDVLGRLAADNSPFQAQRATAPQAESREAPTLEPRRALLFDLDGVLYNPREVLTGAYQHAFRACGRDVTSEALESVLHQSPTHVYRRFGASSQTARPAFNAAYTRLVSELDCIFDPAVAFVRKARAAGYAVGVVTSQPRVRCERVLSRAGLAGELDVIVSWNDLPPARQKPQPDPIERALELLAMPPSCAAYVGDSPNDILAARAARVRSVAVGWGLSSMDTLLRFSPDASLTEFSELDDLLIDQAFWASCAELRRADV